MPWTNPSERRDHRNRRYAQDPSFRAATNAAHRLEYANLSPERKAVLQQRSVAWQKANPDKVKAAQRRAVLKREYGITPEQYDRMHAEQGGVCAICGDQQRGRALDVDHDHVTGAVRGLLCSGCNQTLGKMKDSPDLLRAAAAYLERPRPIIASATEPDPEPLWEPPGPLVGAKNGNSKLTDDQVRDIRQLYVDGITQYELADKYGVSQALISNIVRGKTWKHVEMAST